MTDTRTKTMRIRWQETTEYAAEVVVPIGCDDTDTAFEFANDSEQIDFLRSCVAVTDRTMHSMELVEK